MNVAYAKRDRECHHVMRSGERRRVGIRPPCVPNKAVNGGLPTLS
jgi:hypothetical protein